jgi:serine/threonine-protein kinase RsbT
MTPTYRNLLTVLSRYLSQLNAQLALDRSLRRLDLTPASVGDQHVNSLLPYLERSLNLFVERNRLPHVLAELGQQQTAAQLEEKIITLKTEADLTEARILARQMCQDIGAGSLTRQKVITLVSELARNIVLYAQQGSVQLSPLLEPRKRIVVRATDTGPGIVNLPQIMAGEYKSKTGLGMGLRGCKRLADRFEIDTGAWGTRIEAEVQI